MDGKLFWLILIEDSKVVVSLDKKIGSVQEWDIKDPNSIKKAVDTSLSDLAQENSISEENEPDTASFVLPPLWVNKDNKISPEKLILLENLCHSLHFKPIGFIAHDEAILEDFGNRESFPCSFVLIHVSQYVFNISIAYLGKITHRIQGFFDNGFDVTKIEKTLFDLKTDSTLPPQIILLGDIDDEKIDAIRNYSWVGKKNIETFLHLPDVNFIGTSRSISIFNDVISKQISTAAPNVTIEPEIESEPEVITEAKIEPEIETINEKDNTDDSIGLFNIFSEVSKESLGFTKEAPIEEVIVPKENVDLDLNQEINPDIKPELIPVSMTEIKPLERPIQQKIFLKPKIKFNLPKFRFKNKILLFFIPLFIIFSLTYFFIYKTKVTLYATPYEFTKEVNISLSTEKETTVKNLYVSSKKISIPINSSIPTTGTKIIGDKAKGEVIIYNKLEEPLVLDKGGIFIDPTGKNFVLLNKVTIPASSNELEEGIIKLGQVKAVLEAAEFGSEYNIAKDVTFKSEDNNTNLIIKSDEEFTGGSKEEIRAVAKQDIVNLENIIEEDITTAVNQKIEEETKVLLGAIPESIITDKQKISFNRQVGEEIDELVGEVVANVSILILNKEDKQKFILENFNLDEEFNHSILNLDEIVLSFELTKINQDSASGSVNIKGNLLPKIDIGQFKKAISGKSFTNLTKVIRTNRRIYNHKYSSNIKFFDFIKLLPFKLENISIDVKL